MSHICNQNIIVSIAILAPLQQTLGWSSQRASRSSGGLSGTERAMIEKIQKDYGQYYEWPDDVDDRFLREWMEEGTPNDFYPGYFPGCVVRMLKCEGTGSDDEDDENMWTDVQRWYVWVPVCNLLPTHKVEPLDHLGPP